LIFIEQDSTNLKTLLRSDHPQKVDCSIEYFELYIKPDPQITLYRISSQNHKKTRTPFVINYDLLERFIKDCQDIMSGV
jgi:hypothetical protein